MTYHDRTLHAGLGQKKFTLKGGLSHSMADALHELAPSLREVPQPKEALPLYLVDDMASARRRFRAMGFEMCGASGRPGAELMRAGASHILLLEIDVAKRTLPPEVVASFNHGPALYIWVDSVMETRARLADPVLGEMVTGYGTWELFVESRIGLIIFAEKLSH